MGLAFYILMAVSILFAAVSAFQRMFSPRPGAGSGASGLFTLAFFLAVVVALIFPSDVRYFAIDHFKNKVVSVDGPNAFTVRVWRKVHLVLSDTIAPASAAEAQKAEQALRDRILGKKVAIDFPAWDKRRPRPAVVVLGKANINESLISDGFLQRAAVASAPANSVSGSAPVTPPAAAAQPSTAVPGALPPASTPMPAPVPAKRPSPASRFFIWFIGGSIGAAFFSRALLGRKLGLDLFLAFVLLAVRDVALAVRADASLAPPLIALALALIAGPGLRSADFWAPLRERMR